MNRPLKIFLADLTYTTLSLATEAFPLNVGFVGAYCKQEFGNDVEIQIFKYVDDLDQAINDDPPDVLGVSNYPWNHRLGIEFFKMARQLYPQTVCVMGGPNIPLTPQGQDEFMSRNPEVDFYSYLEGEQAFSNLIERALDVGPNPGKLKQSPIDGVIARLGETEMLRGQLLKRRKHLSEIPSPYLTGMMDKFFDGILSPMMETNRGCPFTCTFCHEGNTLLTKVNYFSLDRVIEELNYISEKVPANVNYLMFADPNFGMFERDFEICEHIAKIQEKKNWPLSIFASTGKNRKERIAKSLQILKGTLRLWMSVQSMDQLVLENIKRQNIKLDAMMGLMDVFKEMGLPTCSELILGLPGETFESHIRSISELIDAGIDTIGTYNLMMLHGTELALQPSRKKFGLKTHYRILPRDFGKLSNGEVAVEIEEIVTSTNDMSLEEYVQLRLFHFIINTAYNGGAFKPLYKFLRSRGISAFELLRELVKSIDRAPDAVRLQCSRFLSDTRRELWDSREELLEFAKMDGTYGKLISGELGGNLLQTYQAQAIIIFEEWVDYLFDSLRCAYPVDEWGEDAQVILQEINCFCKGLTYNIWGETRNQENPQFSFTYDIGKWLKSEKNESLDNFDFKDPVDIQFCFLAEQQQEMQAYIDRLGNTPTGIGRVISKYGIHRIWRNPIFVSP